MNIPIEVLNAHRLFLRDDFEEELGVLDQFRIPDTKEQWEARLLRAKERGARVTMSYSDHLEGRANEPFPVLFAIFAISFAGRTEPCAIVADSYKTYPVPFKGLFYDATLRINSAMGLPIEGPCPIVGERWEGQSPNVGVRGSHFLLHNRLRHTFHVVPGEFYRGAMLPGTLP